MELTDEDGQMAWSGTYKAWGFAEEKRNDAVRTVKIGNQLRFQGQYFDSETKLHYNRHRYYDPQIGRFVGKDPISFSGGINIYQYAPNSTQWIDPLGLARSGQWVAVGNGRIRIDPPHVENTDQQVHAHCQCKTRRREVVINKDGSQSHKSRGSSTELTRTEKDFLRDKGFKL
jgi:RHS repeat-associated protein